METNKQVGIFIPERDQQEKIHKQQYLDVPKDKLQIEQQHQQPQPQPQRQLQQLVQLQHPLQQQQMQQQHDVSMNQHQPPPQDADSQQQSETGQLASYLEARLEPTTQTSSLNLHAGVPKPVQSESVHGHYEPSSDQPTASPTVAEDTSITEPEYFVVMEPPQKVTQSLSLKMDSEDKVGGVITEEMIEKGVEFGPYTGTLLSEDEGWSKDTTWEICISGRVFFYIDGLDTWMSNLQCAQSVEEQNMEAIQYYGEIYFRTTKVVEPGSELKVFYSEDYAKRVGIQTRLDELNFNHHVGKFQCSQCKGLFTSAKLLLRHMRCEHPQDEVDDAMPTLVWRKKTNKKAIENAVIRKHFLAKKKAVTKIARFKCGTCKKIFSSHGRLKEHQLFHNFNENRTRLALRRRDTNIKIVEKPKKKRESNVHRCGKCSRTFASERTLLKHIQDFGKSHGYKCGICSERFSNKKVCRKHEKTHKTPTSPVEEVSPDQPSDMLGKSFNYYKGHFKCRFCPRYFSLRSSAKYHEKEMHSGELMFKCSLCPKSFPKRCRLLDHMRNHEQNRIYRCTLCPRTFASQSALTNHQGEHTGLKPHKCEICGKGFKTKQSVYEHKLRMHQERKMRFFCSVCNKGFASKGNLTKHERRHKGIRPFVCLECGKPFTAKGILRNHIQAIHSKEKAFTCEICGKSFALNQTYTLHMFKHRDKGEVVKPIEQSEDTQAVDITQGIVSSSL